jgi:hypothetical protein
MSKIKEAGNSEVDRIQKLPVKQPDGTYARPIKGADGNTTMQPMPKGWDPFKGAKQSIDNIAMLGKAYSTQHMMQPAPQLETADLSEMKLPKAEYKGVGYHSRFGQIIGNDDKGQKNVIGNDDKGQKNVKGPGFDQWKRELHNTREREKASAASSLIKNGYGSLVHPDMVNHLKKYGNDPDQALNHQTGLSLGPAKSQANFPDAKEPMTLDEMKAHNSDTSQQPYYLIGPPRGMVHLPDSEIINKVGNENVGSSDKRLRPDDNDEEAGPSKRLKLDEDLMDVD